MKHVTVYADPRFYAGWPSNHGAWQGDNEFLVGFMRGPYGSGNGMHKINKPYEKLLARSEDGGESWTVELPNVDFEGTWTHGQATMAEPTPTNLDGWPQEIYRVCGVYDTGGEDCYPNGAYYRSLDQGKKWSGPYAFTGLQLPEGQIFTGRTRILQSTIFNKREQELWFMTKGSELIFGTDDCFVMRRLPEGVFEHVGIVLDDECRAACPAVAELGGRIVCTLRRRGIGRKDGWIDAVVSDNGGYTWSSPQLVGYTGSYNGNPPALCFADGRLICCFANRSTGSIRVAESVDGIRWAEYILREGGGSDIGYPQLFVRTDGTPVCVYYWSDGKTPQHIVATSF